MKPEFVHIDKPHRMVLEYSILGEGEPFLYLHGGGLDHYAARYFLEKLGKKFKVYAFTYPGFRSSTSFQGGYSVEKFLIIIREFLKEMELEDEKIIVGGHSMGGGLSLAYASEFPEYTKAAAVFTPLTFGLKKNLIAANRGVLKSRKDGEKHPDYRNHPVSALPVFNRFIGINPRDLKKVIQIHRFANKLDITDRLPKLKVPTILFSAAHDSVVDPQDQLKLAEMIECKHVHYEEDGHYLLYTKTADIIEKIEEFVKKL